MSSPTRLRVFVSYSSHDEDHARRVFRRLEDLHCRPFKEFTPGQHFDREIMLLIEYAHLFMPILTGGSGEHQPGSHQKPWVNQEIGYALGRNVPILPLALDTDPKGLVTGIQTVKLSADLDDLEEKLTRPVLEQAFSRRLFEREPPYELALEPEDRSRMLIRYLNEVASYERGRIRVQGAFTSFSIPDKHPSDPIWNKRDSPHRLTNEARTLLQKERKLFEEFAREAGCDLILNPVLKSAIHTGESIRVRIEILREFLLSMPADRVRVLVRDSDSVENRAIVGDWFFADSVVPFGGSRLRKTVFTRHGATVLERIAEFEDLLAGGGTRDDGLDQLEKLLQKL